MHKQVSHSEELVNVSAAMMVSFDGDSDIIADMTLAFGGIRPKTIVASNTRKGSLRRCVNSTRYVELDKHTELPSLPIWREISRFFI